MNVNERPPFVSVGGYEHFVGVPTSVGAARRYVARRLNGLSRDIADAVVLMVSELATNAVRHGSSDFELRIETQGDCILVEVRDAGAGRPELRTPRAYDAYGRGLRIVDELSTSWGVSEQQVTKAVWFTVDLAER